MVAGRAGESVGSVQAGWAEMGKVMLGAGTAAGDGAVNVLWG